MSSSLGDTCLEFEKKDSWTLIPWSSDIETEIQSCLVTPQVILDGENYVLIILFFVNGGK